MDSVFLFIISGLLGTMSCAIYISFRVIDIRKLQSATLEKIKVAEEELEEEFRHLTKEELQKTVFGEELLIILETLGKQHLLTLSSENRLDNIIKDIVHNLSQVSKTVDILINLKDTIPYVKDPDGLRKILKKLLENSIKYSYVSPNEKLRRYIRIVGKINNDFYMLTIEHYGHSIPKEFADEIFEMLRPFQNKPTNLTEQLFNGKLVIQEDDSVNLKSINSTSPQLHKYIIEIPTYY